MSRQRQLPTPATTEAYLPPGPPTPISRSPRPRLITNEYRVTLLEEKLNHAHHFRNEMLALEALQLSNQPLQFQGRMRTVRKNDHLAMFGDKLLDLHLCRQWWPENASTADYTDRRNVVVTNGHLCNVGRERGLDECVISNPGTVQPAGQSAMATTVEAILGAVYLDAEASERDSGVRAMAKVATELGLNFYT